MPEAVSVIGYDNTELAGSALVGLSTIDHHAKELGRLAAETVLRRLAGDAGSRQIKIDVDPLLIVRRTTAPPR